MRYNFILIFIAAGISSCDQTKLPVENANATVETRHTNNIRQYLTRVASDITKNSLASINSSEEWQSIQANRSEEFIEMISLGDMPLKGKRPPLNVTITGTLQKEGYRIEKLYYESLPGLYVAANLYLPDNIEEPTAAILYLSAKVNTPFL